MQVNPDCLTSYARVTSALSISSAFSASDFTDTIKLAINDASRLIREYCRRPLKYQVVTDEKHDGRECKDIVLVDRWPIISLEDFYDDPNRDYGSDTQLTVADDEIEIVHAASGAIRRVDAIFGQGQNNLKIDYTGGFSEFYITPLNNKLNFNDGGAELTATIASGLYNAGSLATAIDTALTAAGGNSYTVTYDDTIHRFTLTSDGTFALLWATGTNTAVMDQLADILGFDTSADDTGALTYTSDNAVVGVPSDLELACVDLSVWNYMQLRENWVGKTSEQRADQAYSFDFMAIPKEISARLNRYTRRVVG